MIEYPNPYVLKLRDWIDINKLNWTELTQNPNSIKLLEENIDKIDWFYLSNNPNAIHLIKKYIGLKHLDMGLLSTNSSPGIIELFRENKKLKIHWKLLSLNTSPDAIKLIEKNLWKIDWYYLSKNENAITILEKNLKFVDFKNFSKNPCAVPILFVGIIKTLNIALHNINASTPSLLFF
jgi:hypothetical protein